MQTRQKRSITNGACLITTADKYNDRLSEVMPPDMAKVIVSYDSEVYYISDYC